MADVDRRQPRVRSPLALAKLDDRSRAAIICAAALTEARTVGSRAARIGTQSIRRGVPNQVVRACLTAPVGTGATTVSTRHLIPSRSGDFTVFVHDLEPDARMHSARNRSRRDCRGFVAYVAHRL